MTAPLQLFSTDIVDKLLEDLPLNLDRYLEGDFRYLEKESGWKIETNAIQWDPSVISKLDPSRSPEAEARNSLLIFNALRGMTPAAARDERIWTRLCHIDCFEYARSRWVTGSNNAASKIRAHFFATNFTGCRDDNAIGRLWWNTYIARLAFPSDVESGLRRLLARANFRLQIIDRADTAFRRPVISGVLRVVTDPWFDSRDSAIADFMYEVNKRSGGIVFEALTELEVDAHMKACLEAAKDRRA